MKLAQNGSESYPRIDIFEEEQCIMQRSHSEIDGLHAAEDCPIARLKRGKTLRSDALKERLLLLWRGLGRAHPVVLRRNIRVGCLSPVDPDLLTLLEWSWDMYTEDK